MCGVYHEYITRTLMIDDRSHVYVRNTLSCLQYIHTYRLTVTKACALRTVVVCGRVRAWPENSVQKTEQGDGTEQVQTLNIMCNNAAQRNYLLLSVVSYSEQRWRRKSIRFWQHFTLAPRWLWLSRQRAFAMTDESDGHLQTSYIRSGKYGMKSSECSISLRFTIFFDPFGTIFQVFTDWGCCAEWFKTSCSAQHSSFSFEWMSSLSSCGPRIGPFSNSTKSKSMNRQNCIT